MKQTDSDSFSRHLWEEHRQFLAPALVFLAAAFITPLLTSILALAVPGCTENTLYSRIIQVLSSILLFGIPPLTYALTARENPAASLGLIRPRTADWTYLLIVIISSIPAVNLLSDINLSIHLPESMQTPEAQIRESHRQSELSTDRLLNVSSPALMLANIITIALIPAVTEELFFRGWIQTSLARRMNPHIAILITAIVFSALHFQPLAFIPRTAFGLIYGYILLRSGSLWLTMTAHFVNNAVIVLFAYLSTAYGIGIDTQSPGTGSSWPLALAGLALLIFALARMKHATETKHST